MLREHQLPGVARMVKRGWIADGSVTVWPSKTAVSHFAVFSGCLPGRSGVTGNAVNLLPRSEHTLLETRSGFDANSHRVEPIWVHAAKNGRRVLALSAAGSYPPTPDLARLKGFEGNYTEYSGFEATIQKGRLWKGAGGQGLEAKVGDQTFQLRPVREQGWYTALEVSQGGERTSVEPRPEGDLTAWSKPFWVSKGVLAAPVRFRLWRLDPTTGDFEAYQWVAAGMQGTESTGANRKYLESYGAFHDDRLSDYARGELGPTLWQGGEGQAEARQLEIIRKDCEFLKAGFRYGLRSDPDLVFHYSPMADSTGHALMGVLDPTSGAHDPVLAARLWPFYESVVRALDDWLSDMQAAAPEADFVLFSDHGMQGVSRFLSVNRVLADAGLATFSGKEIDLSKSLAFAPPSGDFFVSVNTQDWKGGIVALKERGKVVERAAAALLAFVDPSTGKRPVRRALRGRDLTALGLVGPTCGDLYLDLEPDYYPRNGFAEVAVSRAAGPIGAGVHGFDPTRESMQAVLAMGGPGVDPKGKRPRQRHIDVFPTVCRLMALPDPTGIDGRAIR